MVGVKPRNRSHTYHILSDIVHFLNKNWTAWVYNWALLCGYPSHILFSKQYNLLVSICRGSFHFSLLKGWPWKSCSVNDNNWSSNLGNKEYNYWQLQDTKLTSLTPLTHSNTDKETTDRHTHYNYTQKHTGRHTCTDTIIQSHIQTSDVPTIGSVSVSVIFGHYFYGP